MKGFTDIERQFPTSRPDLLKGIEDSMADPGRTVVIEHKCVEVLGRIFGLQGAAEYLTNLVDRYCKPLVIVDRRNPKDPLAKIIGPKAWEGPKLNAFAAAVTSALASEDRQLKERTSPN